MTKFQQGAKVKFLHNGTPAVGWIASQSQEYPEVFGIWCAGRVIWQNEKKIELA